MDEFKNLSADFEKVIDTRATQTMETGEELRMRVSTLETALLFVLRELAHRDAQPLYLQVHRV